MLSSAARSALFLIVFMVLVAGLPFFFGMVKQGNAPVEDGGRTIYRLAFAMQVMGCLAMAGGAAVAWAGATQWNVARWATGVLVVISVVIFYFGWAMVSARVMLDEGGMHYQRAGRDTFIAWAALDHLEMRRDPRVGVTAYFFCAADGRDIAVTDTGYNTQDMLARVYARKPLKELPYTRKQWWRG